MTNGTATQQKTTVVKTVEGVEALALSKYSQPKGNREAVAAGEYPIDMTVHVVGSIKVGKDYEGTVAASVPWQKLALAAMSRLNSDVVESLVKKAAEDNLPKVADDFSDRINATWDKISKKATQTQNGKVTAKLVFVKA